jgi:hypothetical protein
LNVPKVIGDSIVREYGSFAHPILPKGYFPPPGSAPLDPVQNIAICTTDDIDGFYLLYCTPDWKYVTYSFHETINAAKANPMVEFGESVTNWKRV